jgi:hypothetical protein
MDRPLEEHSLINNTEGIILARTAIGMNNNKGPFLRKNT